MVNTKTLHTCPQETSKRGHRDKLWYDLPKHRLFQLALHRHSSSPVPDKAQKSASPAPAWETKDITAHPH